MHDFIAHQEGPTAGSDAVTITTNLLRSSECSNALQVVFCALGRCASGLHFHCKPTPLRSDERLAVGLNRSDLAAHRSNSAGLLASASSALAICSFVGSLVY